ncbi:dual specificity protein phosphatase family protein [Cereibacter sphaeroides]|nr:dual specificity protein phosphatase family protein [Cereibacter sphaeroides]
MAFAIASLPLRHGTLAICPLPSTTAQRAAVSAFAPDLVVTLTRQTEMTELGVEDWPDWLRSHHIPWHPFPIEDYGTPPEGADWPALSKAAAEIFENGGTVLVHCRGGLGRSGMVCLRLMIEAGEHANEALQRLRAARPGAVETEAQLRWASGEM